MEKEKPAMFKYGQLMVSNQDIVIEKALSGDKVTIPKGSRVVVGFDGLAHHLDNGFIQPFAKNCTLAGFSSSGIVEVVMDCLFNRFPMEEMCEGYDVKQEEIRQEILDALEEIGLYEKSEV